MSAEELIDEKVRTVKGAGLSGAEVAKLKYKAPILINGRRAVVIDVTVAGDNVELIYAPGAKTLKRDQYLTVRKSDKVTPVQLYRRVEEAMTRGMQNAYKKMENNVLVCVNCGATIPKYPGRYPTKCPGCGEQELEDFQNTPRYSESGERSRDEKNRHRQMRVVSKKTRVGGESTIAASSDIVSYMVEMVVNMGASPRLWWLL